jgi:signal transduction histidine kinase
MNQPEQGLISKLNKAEQELKRVKGELEIQAWGLKKTNEGIKILYKELEKKNAELKKLDQLKSDFVSTVSHELRTPLSIIKDSVSVILGGVAGKVNKKQARILAMSQESMERLERIINDLLDISKIEAGKIELKRKRVDFCHLLKGVCAKWKIESDKKKQSLRVSLPAGSINLRIDPDKIIQVLNNLISNAIKFTPRKGKISIGLTNKERRIEVSVSDNGIGIGRDDLPRMFTKFQQFNRTASAGAKGTGLGMAIAKELLRLHGGSIRVESRLNQGSRFSFSIPKNTRERKRGEND